MSDENESFSLYFEQILEITCLIEVRIVAIHYDCKHCSKRIGTLDQKEIDVSILGFDQLTNKDLKEMITYDHDGNMQVNAICEDCHRTLEQHPDYHELDDFLH